MVQPQNKKREEKRGSGRLYCSSLRLNFLTPRNATITENSLVFLIPGYYASGLMDGIF